MKKIKYNLLFILDFLYIFLISIVFYFTLTLQTSRVIHIPSGSINSIITYLTSTSYNLNTLDNIALRILGSPQKGWIDLKSTHLTKADFLYQLTTSKAALKTITLIPGETSYFFLKQLSEELNLSQKKLQYYYDQHKYKLDGNILAESYSIPIGMTESRVIYFLVDYTNTQYKKYSQKIFNHYDRKKWYKYITIASIIQKEAASVKEMPLISSVIYNRLKKGMKLQMDGTLNYGKYSHTKVTSKMIRSNRTNYNTYKIKGLPTNPICAISFDAIKAAIKPAKTNYLYFVKAKNGKKHIFSTKYKTHKYNIRSQKTKKIKKVTKRTRKAQKVKKNQKKRSIKNIWQSVY